MRPATEPPDIVAHPSPNWGERVGVIRPSLVVLHFTGMDSTGSALERLCNPVAELSAHYMIDRGGTIFRLVDEAKRAWHAGAGSWGGLRDVNSRSIGIELDNDGRSPFAAPLMDALEVLLADILSRHRIAADGVIGHQDMAPGRKEDPGPLFDWRRLSRAGLSVWPDPQDVVEPDHGAFRRALSRFGYPTDAADATLLTAFRNRFRPRDPAPFDGWDVAMAEDLARRFPFDRSGARA